MQTLHYEKHQLTIAQEWNELTGRQLIKLMEVIHQGKTRLQQQIMALQILSGKNKLFYFRLKPDVMDAFLPYVNWVFEENKLTQQLLPMYDELHGPASAFGNLRMKEFHFTELHYANYMEENKVEDLNLLVATLYRPAGKQGSAPDPRQPFDDVLTEQLAAQVAQWPLNLRLAILFWYDGCREDLVKTYDKVFAGGSNDTDEEKAPYGLYALMMDLAGEKLGTVHQVEDMYVHPALASLELMMISAEKLEEQMQKGN